jgi:tartrate dehydrogenase/decarboxylase/D-malate dehydrogenase
VVPEGLAAMRAAAEVTGSVAIEAVDYPWSCQYYAEHGRMMDADALDRMRDSSAIFLGAIGFPGVPDHVSLWNMLLPLRQAFDLSVNLRPMRLLPGIPGPLCDRTLMSATKSNALNHSMVFWNEARSWNILASQRRPDC